MRAITLLSVLLLLGCGVSHHNQGGQAGIEAAPAPGDQDAAIAQGDGDGDDTPIVPGDGDGDDTPIAPDDGDQGGDADASVDELAPPARLLPRGTEDDPCIEVGEPFVARCEGSWCLETISTPMAYPTFIGGSSARDIWVWNERGEVAHRGCTGWALVPDAFTPQPECNELTCTFAATAPDDAWLVSDAGVFHFDGSAWSLADLPATVTNPRVQRAHDDVWLTSLSGVHAYRFESGGWVAHDAGLMHPVSAISGDASGEVWAVSLDSVLRFDGASWSAVEMQPPAQGGPSSITRYDSIDVLAADDVWIGGRDDEPRHWDGASWQHIDAVGPLFVASPDEVWLDHGSHPARFDGTAFEPLDVLSTRFVTAIGAINGHMWTADTSGTISFFEDGELHAAIGEHSQAEFIESIAGFAADDRWGLVYDGTVMRQDGSGWREVYELEPDHIPNDEIGGADSNTGIFARASDDVWLASVRNGVGTVIVHWDGSDFDERTLARELVGQLWSASAARLWAYGARKVFTLDTASGAWTEHTPIALAAGESLRVLKLSGSADDNVWLAGDVWTGSSYTRHFVARWDGDAWSELSLPSDSNSIHLLAVRSPSDVMLGGFYALLHWDGLALQPSPAFIGSEVFPSNILVVPGGSYLATLDQSNWFWDGSVWTEDVTLRGKRATFVLSRDQMWGETGSSDGVWRYAPSGP